MGDGRSAVDDLCTRERLAAVQRTVDTLNETVQADRGDFARELRALWEAMASQAAPPPGTVQSSPLIEVGTTPLGAHHFAALPPKVFGQSENFSDVSTSASVAASCSHISTTPILQPAPSLSPPIALRALAPCRSPSPMQRVVARGQ